MEIKGFDFFVFFLTGEKVTIYTLILSFRSLEVPSCLAVVLPVFHGRVGRGFALTPFLPPEPLLCYQIGCESKKKLKLKFSFHKDIFSSRST